MKRISAQNYLYVRRAMLIAAIVGFFASCYLLITYVSGKPIICGTVSGCEIVRASPQAKTFFDIPRPALGVFFYSVLMGALIARVYLRRRSSYWTMGIIAWTGFGFIESAWLFLVQAFQIHAFCTWCLISGAASTIAFALAFFEGEDEPDVQGDIRELRWTFYTLLIAVLGGGFMMWSLLSDRVGGILPKLEPSQSVEQNMQALVPVGTQITGLATSTVTVLEFIDVECPGCRAFHPVIQQLRQEYGDRVRFAQRLFPLYEIHTHAKTSAIAAVCAGKQGKYWEYVDAAVLNQQRLEREDLVRYAGALKLDTAAFSLCLDDRVVASIVDAERKAGEKLGINSTPTLFVNDEILSEPPSYEEFKKILDQKLGK